MEEYIRAFIISRELDFTKEISNKNIVLELIRRQPQRFSKIDQQPKYIFNFNETFALVIKDCPRSLEVLNLIVVDQLLVRFFSFLESL